MGICKGLLYEIPVEAVFVFLDRINGIYRIKIPKLFKIPILGRSVLNPVNPVNPV